MITISRNTDLNWINLYRVAYQSMPLEIDEKLLQQVDGGHAHFLGLIAGGLPSYGVTTGLGKLVNAQLDDAARAELPANMLRARAVAIGAGHGCFLSARASLESSQPRCRGFN